MPTSFLFRLLMIFAFTVLPLNTLAVQWDELLPRLGSQAAWADDEEDLFDSDDEIDDEEDDQAEDEITDDEFEEAEDEEIEETVDEIFDDMDDDDEGELSEDEDEDDEPMSEDELDSAESEGGQMAEDAEVDNALRS
jgi:hypothetical protein